MHIHESVHVMWLCVEAAVCRHVRRLSANDLHMRVYALVVCLCAYGYI